ncbi:MAG: hypothetical protein KC561_13110, partial [Myxococcales bacterium]|nr:hypothetical protein [Myxococcales bacterium]
TASAYAMTASGGGYNLGVIEMPVFEENPSDEPFIELTADLPLNQCEVEVGFSGVESGAMLGSQLRVTLPGVPTPAVSGICGYIPAQNFSTCLANDDPCQFCSESVTSHTVRVPRIPGAPYRFRLDAQITGVDGFPVNVGGTALSASCPGTIEVPLDIATQEVDLVGEVTFADSNFHFDWQPEGRLSELSVITSAQQTRWQVRAPQNAGWDELMVGPIDYGTVPAGATQIVPAGSPEAMQPGDDVIMLIDYTDSLGNEVTGCWSTDPSYCP